jgi:ubiquitin conjugation factor E4 B
LKSPEDDHGICHEFMTEAVSRLDEDESVKPMLTKTVAGLSYQLAQLDMDGDYRRYIDVCAEYRASICIDII